VNLPAADLRSGIGYGKVRFHIDAVCALGEAGLPKLGRPFGATFLRQPVCGSVEETITQWRLNGQSPRIQRR
jgi:hypothetical protein